MQALAAALVVVSLGVSASAQAGIIVLEDLRRVTLAGQTVQPSPGQIFWTGSLSSPTGAAQQSCQFSLFGCSGRVDTFDPTTLGESVFEVAFTVDVPSFYELILFHSTNTLGASEEFRGSFSDSNGLIVDLGVPGSRHTGFLTPGTEYRLIAGVFGIPGGIYTVPATFEINGFSLIPAGAPEPTAGVLAGLGIAALAQRRRRR